MIPLDFSLNATPSAELDLSGTWQIAIDPEDRGKSEQWFLRDPVSGAVAAEVPSPLELTFPGYDGVVWYWVLFEGEDLLGYDDVRIRFGGADYFAEAWLNGEYLGGDESALLPFAFDLKRALRSETNKLVVRVIDACYDREIDGFQMPNVPGGRQHDDPLQPGWRHYNYGGLLLPVAVQAFRRPWIADGFIKPVIGQNRIDVDLLIAGDSSPVEWRATVRPVYPLAQDSVTDTTTLIAPDEEGRAAISVELPDPHRWEVWDAFLYELQLSPTGGPDSGTVWRDRFGMREISILDGRLAVNGAQILQRSYLYNMIWPVTLGVPYREMARKDIELTRESNANMLRCFSKTPVPATVEAADEVGILLQPETLGSWYLLRGEKELERLKNLTERTVLAYRNHPSIAWWNILNENNPAHKANSPRHLGDYALGEILPAIHDLDPTRPAIANDPIWHDVPNIWEPGATEPTLPLVQNHYYQFTNLENHEDSWLEQRGRAWGKKPRPDSPFLGITEWGQCSSPEWSTLVESYRSSGLWDDAEDYTLYRKLHEMNHGWYEKSGIKERGFPTFESLQEANRETVAYRYREHFALFWGNTCCAGHGMTSLEDSSYEFSGVLDTWRNKKPVVFDTITELNRPLQINLWVRPTSIYPGDEITFDATLVNEGGRLATGNYSLIAKVVDSQSHAVLETESPCTVSGDVIEFLAVETLVLDVGPGWYRLQLEIRSDGADATGDAVTLTAQQPVHVSERREPAMALESPVWVWETGDSLKRWLAARGVDARDGGAWDAGPQQRTVVDANDGDLLIVVDSNCGPDETKSIQTAVRGGARAIFLTPQDVFDSEPESDSRHRERIYSGLLEPVAGEWKPELRRIDWWGSPGAWGYGRAPLAMVHPFLDGLPQGVAFESQPEYQRVAPQHTWVLSGQPDNLAISSAVLESCVHVDLPYTSDLLSVQIGKGTLVLSTLRIAEYIGIDPAADRILENILQNHRET